MTDINKNFKVKQGLETPTISVDSTATFSKGVQATTGLAVGGTSLDSNGRAKIIYNSTLSATAILGNYVSGTEGPVLLRAFGQNRTGGTSSTAPQPSYLAEGARGTGASPLAPTSAQLVALFGSGGYDGNKWTSDYETTSTNILLNPGSLFWYASESWTNALGSGSTTATNVGTGMAITVQPTGFRMDVNSRQRLMQTSWTAGSANTPPVLNIGLGNGNSATPTLTNAAGTVQHTGFGRSDISAINSTFYLYGPTSSANGVQFTGEISGTTLTVTAMNDASQSLSVGQRIYSNASGAWGSILTATTITALGSGTGGSGTYTVSQSQTVASGTLYAGNDNGTLTSPIFNTVASRRSGASGRRNSLKVNDSLGAYLFQGMNADNSTGIGATVGGLYMNALENYTGSAYGSRMQLQTVNSGTTTLSARIRLDDQVIEHRTASHTFKDASASNTFLTVSSTGLDYSRTFGSFINTGTITPAAANTAYVLPLNTTNTASNATLSNTGTITIQKAGHYNIQFSLQLNNSDNAEQALYVWFRKNGSDIANSNTEYDLLKNSKSVAALNLVEYFAANDTVEIAYAVGNTAITMPYYASTSTPFVRPATPSAIVSIVPVGA